MTEIVIPIKDLSFAKQRLMDVLDAAERAQLVLAMLTDLLGAATEADCGAVLVVASNEAVFDIARHFGAACIRETDVRGYNVASALGLARSAGGNVAVLPGDIPLATADEIRCLCAPAHSDSRCIRLAPSRDQRGTNGMFLATPELLRPSFGLNSFARHCTSARQSGCEPTLVEAPGLARDIDTPHDLHDLARTASQGATFAFLQGLRDRLQHAQHSRGVA